MAASVVGAVELETVQPPQMAQPRAINQASNMEEIMAERDACGVSD